MQFATEGGELKCCYLHKPRTMDITGNYDILVNWSIYNAVTGNLELSKSGYWSTNYSDVVQFPEYFPEATSRIAELGLTYIQK
jgi:hypothetical protein